MSNNAMSDLSGALPWRSSFISMRRALVIGQLHAAAGPRGEESHSDATGQLTGGPRLGRLSDLRFRTSKSGSTENRHAVPSARTFHDRSPSGCEHRDGAGWESVDTIRAKHVARKRIGPREATQTTCGCQSIRESFR